MTDREADLPQEPCSKALFRYLCISEVMGLVQKAESLAKAVRIVAARNHPCIDGSRCRVSRRSLYRWVKQYKSEGWNGLQSKSRSKSAGSTVVPAAFLSFAEKEKLSDPAVSVPELIRRARQLGILSLDQRLDRTTVYRALQRMGVCLQRRKTPAQNDTHRFAYEHRMEMVLVDGKHFRAGAQRRKRVAFFYLDDSTRMGLGVIVGTSESTALFLHGLYQMICNFGFPGILYMDHGPGFKANDTALVVANFPSLLILGQTAYPQGHGKIERFNQTALSQLLRSLDRRPDVDPDCGALTLRLDHWMKMHYNHAPHESLNRASPYQRFCEDAKPLRMPESLHDLRNRFILHLHRRVSNDHIVSVNSVDYEVPRGYAGAKVPLHYQLLDGSVHLLHHGKLIELHRVDLVFNAHSPRAIGHSKSEPIIDTPLPPSAADLDFQKDYLPLVDPDGGFSIPDSPQPQNAYPEDES